MKKILIFLLFASLFYSCNKSQNLDNDSIKFWHFWSEPHQVKVLDSLIDEFTKQTGIEIEVTQLSWNNGKSKLIAAFNSETPPDVLELGSDWVAQFSASNVLAEFKSNELDNFIDFSKEPSMWKNNFYALPWIVDTRVLFVNMDILKKNNIDSIPNSWEEIIKISSKITDKENQIYSIGVNGPDKNRLYKKAITYIWSSDADWELNQINSKENEYALELYKKSAENGIVEIQRNLDRMFIQGKIAFTISGAWLINMLKKDNPNLNYKLIEIPSTNKSKGISFAGGEYIAVSKSSKKLIEAKKFVKWLCDGKNTIEFCKKIPEGGFPADKNYFKDDFFKSNPEKMVFANQLLNSKMTPVHPKWLEIQDILEETYERVLYNYSSPKDALKLAKRKMAVID